MRRFAFKMKLKPGTVAEYKKRHDEIWPELAKELRAAGISDYSIFLDEETLTLFAVRKLTDDNTACELPQSPIVRKWWDFMAPLMEVEPDNAPVCIPLKEVLHLINPVLHRAWLLLRRREACFRNRRAYRPRPLSSPV